MTTSDMIRHLLDLEDTIAAMEAKLHEQAAAIADATAKCEAATQRVGKVEATEVDLRQQLIARANALKACGYDMRDWSDECLREFTAKKEAENRERAVFDPERYEVETLRRHVNEREALWTSTRQECLALHAQITTLRTMLPFYERRKKIYEAIDKVRALGNVESDSHPDTQVSRETLVLTHKQVTQNYDSECERVGYPSWHILIDLAVLDAVLADGDRMERRAHLTRLAAIAVGWIESLDLQDAEEAAKAKAAT